MQSTDLFLPNDAFFARRVWAGEMDPVLVGQWPGFSQGNTWNVQVQGFHAFTASGDAGFLIFDISDLANPVLVGHLGTFYGKALQVIGPYAYLAFLKQGLQIVDFNDPGKPKWVGGYDTPGNAYDIKVSGKYIYIADGTNGLQIFDAGNSREPLLVGSSDTPDLARRVDINGDYAYG